MDFTEYLYPCLANIVNSYIGPSNVETLRSLVDKNFSICIEKYRFTFSNAKFENECFHASADRTF